MDFEDDDMYVSNRKRRRAFLYGSFLLCLLGAALGSAALGTQNWYHADVTNMDDAAWEGTFNTGLFQGKSTLVGLAPSDFIYYTVCSDGSCMFSCGSTKNIREKHLQQVMDGTMSLNNTVQCISEGEVTLRSPAGNRAGNQGRSRLLGLISDRRGGGYLDRSDVEEYETRVTDGGGDGGGDQGDDAATGRDKLSHDSDSNVYHAKAYLDSYPAADSVPVSVQLVASYHGAKRTKVVPSSDGGWLLPMAWVEAAVKNDVELGVDQERDSTEWQSTTDEPVTTDSPGGGGPEISGSDGLLSHGLWAGTIACLSLGLLFAVLGAIFAVVNTATTPVEAVTGIPGLYMWNGLAAVFELGAVICWAVQFSSHLSSNVLIVDSLGGWTTEGGEALGYSFWLVVVAVVVHVANCALIGFGTYEPTIKEKIQEPDKANNDILLY